MTSVIVSTSSGPVNITVDRDSILEIYGAANAHITDAICSYLSLLDSSPLHVGPGNKKPIRLFRHFAAELQADLKSVVLRYSELYDRIVSSTTLYGSGSITGDYLPEMRDTPVYREYHAWYRTGDPHLLSYLSSFLLYLKKLDFKDDTFNQTAFRGWLRNEEKLAKLTLPDLSGLRTVMAFLLRDFAHTNQYGKYGPGHVSERYKGPGGKSINFTITPRLARAFIQGNAFFPEPIVQCSSLPSLEYDMRQASQRFSRLVFVPKNLKVSRSICIEPNAEMYFQQLVLKDFVDYFDEVLYPFIDLRDQSRNKVASHAGSISGDVDTIDLSSASDLVSMDLIKAIMPRKILYLLLATRSSLVETDAGLKHLRKFAPMGSALCFPIQCLVFLGVNILASVNWRKDSSDMFADVSTSEIIDTIKGFVPDPYVMSGEYRLHKPLVYGDDIVLDSKVTGHVTQMLGRLGFEVNISKSYTASCAFRESCGGFYWNGFDVTPLQYRISADWNGTSITRFAGSCAHANKALEYSYYPLRKHTIAVLRQGEFPLLFSNDDVSCAIKVDGIPYNPHLRRRYNKRLQRSEVRHVTVSLCDDHRINSANHERYGYTQWWDSATRREVDSAPTRRSFSRVDSFDTRPKWVWTPLR